MKTIDIALKDLRRSIRGASFIAYGFVVPFLVTALFSFAFGGIAGGGLDVPATAVQVVNLDAPTVQSGGFCAGQVLVEVLRSPDLAGLLRVTEAADAAAARAAVDRQQAGAAVIIPAGLTAAAFQADGRATVEVYHDPTLTLGPGIVAGIVRGVVDGLAGSQIAASVVQVQLPRAGATVNPGLLQAVALQYGRWAAEMGSASSAGDTRPAGAALLRVRPPAAGEAPRDLRTTILGTIMAGMTVFYLFFTGAATAQTLLEEQEAGTLARLLSTPTRPSAVLGGRALATCLTLIVQVVVLLVASALTFRIDWGAPLPLAAVVLGLVVVAAGFGLFITSLLRNSRQGGVVYGGVLTVMGMVGMIGIFTFGSPSSQGTFRIVSLLVPQGWAVRGLQGAMAGDGLGQVLPYAAATLGMGAAFFAAGLLRFRRRFA